MLEIILGDKDIVVNKVDFVFVFAYLCDFNEVEN